MRAWKRFDPPRVWSLADQWGKGWFETGHPDGRSGQQWWDDTRALWGEACRRLEAVRYAGMTAKELALDGLALMDQAGRKGGPWLGELQRHLLEQVEQDPAANTEAGLRALAGAWLAAQP